MHERSHDTSPEVRLALVEAEMWGHYRTNGLVGKSKEHDQRISKIERWREEIQTIRDMAKWIGLGVLGTIGWLMTDQAAKAISAILHVAGAK